MTELKLSEYYNSGHHIRSVTVLKFLLMPFVFIALLGFPTKYGMYVSTFSNFAAPAFFILCGFFTLVGDIEKRGKKLKRALKRSAILFGIMLSVFVAINIIYLAYFNSLQSVLNADFFRKRNIFNFLVLNVWLPFPMGNSIWFIQSLTYAYIFFIVAQKLKLNKLYLPILILLIAFMIATGELAAFLGFPYHGYPYIPGGAVTRAIPYMLIGMYLRKNLDKLAKIPRYIYLVIFVFGLAAAIGETMLLSRIGKLVYLGHTVGFGIMAVSVCCFATVKPEIKRNYLTNHGRNYSRRMYVLCQPVSLLLWVVAALINPAYVFYIKQYGSIISFLVCFSIAFIIGLVKYVIAVQKTKKEKLAKKNNPQNI